MRRALIPALPRMVTSGVLVLALAGVSACASTGASDYQDEAEGFIEDEDGDYATGVGLTFEDAACEEPASTEVGTTFSCTATASDGMTYTLPATITAENEFSIGQGVPSAAPPVSSAPASAPATTGG